MIDPKSEAMGAWPKKIESCNVPQPFCTFQFDRKIVQPYNFMMPQSAWDEVLNKNKLEFLLAIRFGMQYDLNLINESILLNSSFHTDLYVKFQYFIKKHALKDMAVLMGEFQSQVFLTRFKTTFAVQDLVSLKGKIEKLDPTRLMRNAIELAKNDYIGTVINRQLYNKIFNQDYDLAALKLLSSQGYYPDSLSVTQNW